MKKMKPKMKMGKKAVKSAAADPMPGKKPDKKGMMKRLAGAEL